MEDIDQKRDYHFVSDYCVVIIQDCDNPEMAEKRLADIVISPKSFRLDNIECDDE